MKKIVLTIFILSLTFLHGCTTSTYGHNLKRINENPDQYTMKIYTGGFAFKGTAKEKLEEEIAKFLEEHKEYSAYRIISSKFELIPSGTRFVVEFTK